MPRKRTTRQPPLLTVVQHLPVPSRLQAAQDIRATLAAVGVEITIVQAEVLAAGGMRGLDCWTDSDDATRQSEVRRHATVLGDLLTMYSNHVAREEKTP